ncbi:MAG: homoaconitate hydratase family protein [Chloroflexi bacterium]|nr:homoaconitate hydratase family protein [Chloroflexota bacterium]
MRMTLTEKLLARASGRASVRPGEIVMVEPDVVLSHDNSAAIWEIFQQLPQAAVKRPDRLAITLDHAVPPPTAKHARNHAQIRQFVQAQGISNFFEVGRGICHQVVCEEGIVGPGLTLLGADSHSPHCGWLGAFGAGIGRSEVAALWATGELWLRVPETMRITLGGKLERGVATKDLSIHLIGQLSSDGATYMAVEFTGDGVGSLSPDARTVLTNMMAEMGAKNACMAPDAITWRWLESTLSRTRPQDADERLALFRESALYGDADAACALERQVELGAIEPMVSCPHAVDNVQPLSSVEHTRVDVGFIGTCTNGRLEDLASAAEILRGKRLRRRLLVIPASSMVLRDATEAGYVTTLLEAGATIGTPGCGPCMGNHMGVLAPGEVCVSSANRNFRGRMGERDAEIYLANPAVVAASCVAGYLAHPAEVQGGDSP